MTVPTTRAPDRATLARRLLLDRADLQTFDAHRGLSVTGARVVLVDGRVVVAAVPR
jgi:hypothetical protein